MDERDTVSADHLFQRRADGVDQASLGILSVELLINATDKMRQNFRIGLGCKFMIAVATKLSSAGPVLFRQRRIGRHGESFLMLKFRSMYDGAEEMKPELHALNEADGLFKIADDPRVTPLGRLLRRVSLDELPQLVNVLRGEMSLVGPRPLVGDEDAQIKGWLRRRLDVIPGMTGVWQVHGSSRIPLREMVKMDYLYRANWSLWLDVKILLRTVPLLLSRRGI